MTAIENPGDGKGAPLFHLLNGDLCYANLDIFNAPGVWRDFGNNVARSAANRPWMPALGNHETEFGIDSHAGVTGNAPGGIAAQGAAGNYWNGPYGYGHYLSRFLLPDNGLVNWDGNRLRGNFYAFQVGTVKFISLDADDVIYQDGASAYLNSAPNAAPETTSSGASIPNGTVTYNHGYTGDLEFQAKNNSLVPDYSGGTPNLQTLWLEATLAEARHDSSVDMIVVFMHQCPDVDVGPRQRVRPGHPPGLAAAVRQVRGRPGAATATSTTTSGPTRSAATTTASSAPSSRRTRTRPLGEKVDTRRPSVVTTEPYSHNGTPAWNTAEGTVYLVLGGGGTNGPTNTYGVDTADDEPQAKVITERNAISGSQAAGFTQELGRLGRGRALVGGDQPDRRLRLLHLRRGPGRAARRDDHHLPVLRDPGGEQRGRHRARRDDHAADRADGEVRFRAEGPPRASSADMRREVAIVRPVATGRPGN